MRNPGPIRFQKQMRHGIIAILAALVLTMAGCGGGGGGASVQPDVPPPAPAERNITGRVIVPYRSDAAFASKTSDYNDSLDLDGVPLAGATVTVQQTNLTTTTDAMGNFTLTNVPVDRVIVIQAAKNGLTLFKALSAGSGAVSVNINYQTSVSCLYYQAHLDDLPAGVTPEWLDSNFIFGGLDSAQIKFRDLAQQFGAGQTSTPPHEDESLTSMIQDTADNLPPLFESVSYSHTIINGGEDLTVTFQFRDTSSIRRIYFYMYNKSIAGSSIYGTQPTHLTIDEVVSITSNGDLVTAVMKKTIPETQPEGRYEIGYLFVYDSRYNGINYSAMESDLTGYSPMSASSLIITPKTMDSSPPELESVELSTNQLITAADTLTVTVKARDNGTIDTGEIRITYPGGDYRNAKCTLTFDSSQNLYTCAIPLWGGLFDDTGTGTYTIDMITLTDICGNTLEKTQNIAINVQVPQSDSQPAGFDIQSINLSQATPAAPISVTVTAHTANAYSTPYQAYVKLGIVRNNKLYHMNQSDIQFDFSDAQNYNESAGTWTWTGLAYPNDFAAGDSISVYSVRLIDWSFQESQYYYYPEYHESQYDCSQNECSGIAIQSVPISPQTRTDDEPPALNTLNPLPAVVSRGGAFTLEFTVHEAESGLKSADFNLRCPACPDDVLDSLNFSVNKPVYSGDGIWRVSMPITIPANAGPGTWNIYHITLEDFADNRISLFTTKLSGFVPGNAEFLVQ